MLKFVRIILFKIGNCFILNRALPLENAMVDVVKFLRELHSEYFLRLIDS